MAVPTTITDLSTTANSNSPAGSEVPSSGNGPDEYIRALGSIVRVMRAKGSDVASATTTDLGAATTGDYVHITGTTTITGLGTIAAGIKKIVTFDGALTLTHNGTSLILPGAANITTAAGDVAEFISEGSGNWKCKHYERASGAPVAIGAGSVVAASLAYAAINGQSAETAPAIDDELLIGDTSGSDLNKMTFANFLKVVDGLTEDASPDTANDFLLSYDTSAGAAKKVKPSNLSSVSAAAQSDQETATSTTTYVSPGRQQFHPSAAKAWALVTISGGTPTLAAGYNVASLTDNGIGDISLNFTTNFSTSAYGVSASAQGAGATIVQGICTRAVGSYRAVWIRANTGAAVDPDEFTVVIYGDL